MKAQGRDGRWREWDELTDEERREWMEAMNEADRYVEERKRREPTPTVAENITRYEHNKRFIY